MGERAESWLGRVLELEELLGDERRWRMAFHRLFVEADARADGLDGVLKRVLERQDRFRVALERIAAGEECPARLAREVLEGP